MMIVNSRTIWMAHAGFLTLIYIMDKSHSFTFADLAVLRLYPRHRTTLVIPWNFYKSKHITRELSSH